MNAGTEDPAVEAILTEATGAVGARDWTTVLRLTSLADMLDPGNHTAAALRRVAESMGVGRRRPLGVGWQFTHRCVPHYPRRLLGGCRNTGTPTTSR